MDAQGVKAEYWVAGRQSNRTARKRVKSLTRAARAGTDRLFSAGCLTSLPTVGALLAQLGRRRRQQWRAFQIRLIGDVFQQPGVLLAAQ